MHGQDCERTGEQGEPGGTREPPRGCGGGSAPSPQSGEARPASAWGHLDHANLKGQGPVWPSGRGHPSGRGGLCYSLSGGILSLWGQPDRLRW